MRLLFFLAVWKRPEVTEICFMGLNRLRDSGIFPMSFLAVISEESMIPLCEKYGVEWCFYKNDPLGEKKNFGIKEALKKDFDYLVELGSDDLIKTELLEKYAPLFSRGYDTIGICNFAVINSDTGQCKEYRERVTATFGLARCIRREALEQIPKLWPDNLNKTLDGKSHFNLIRNGFWNFKRIITEKPLAIDIKSAVNIWSFDDLPGNRITFDSAIEGLSDEEIEGIKALQYVKV
jgi:hypothetical protein